MYRMVHPVSVYTVDIQFFFFRGESVYTVDLDVFVVSKRKFFVTRLFFFFRHPWLHAGVRGRKIQNFDVFSNRRPRLVFDLKHFFDLIAFFGHLSAKHAAFT